MAITALQLQAKVTADTAEAERNLQRLRRAANAAAGAGEGAASGSGGGGGLKGLLSHMLAIAGGIGIVGAVTGAFDLLKGALVSVVQQAAYSQQVQAQTNAVLKSTHGVAGMTAQAINDLAEKYMKLTGIDDEAIQSAENVLLTFTGIGKKVFPQATQAVLDLSTAMHMDLQSASILVGKALQDPIKGVTALRRVGVQLSDQQLAQIKHFMSINDLADAQKIILGELAKETGGSATAAGKTFTGQWNLLKATLGNVAETIGGAVLPVLTSLLQNVIIPLVTWIGDHLGPVLRGLGDIIGRYVAPVLSGLWDTAKKLAETFFGALGPHTDDVRKSMEKAHGPIKKIGDVLGVVKKAANDAKPAFDKVHDGLQKVHDIADKLKPVVQAIADFIKKHVVPAFDTLTGDIKKNVLPKLGDLKDALGDPNAGKNAKKGIINLFQALGDIVDHVAGTFDGATKAVGTVIEGYARLVTFIKKDVLPRLHDLWAWVQNKVTPAWQQMQGPLHDTLTHLGHIWSLIKKDLGPAFEDLVKLIKADVEPRLHILGKVAQTLAIVQFGQFLLMLELIVRYVDFWITGIDRLLTGLDKLKQKLDSMPGFWKGFSASSGIPHFAHGGNTDGGPFVAAENGPELLMTPGVYNAPAGSRILSASDTRRALSGRGRDGGNTYITNVYPQQARIDTRELARIQRRRELLASGGGRI